jgi:hypothetical protein
MWSSRVASRRFRLCHPQGRSEAEHPGGRSPEGLTEAKGAVRLNVLRTGMRLTGRGLVGPCARGWKLPSYAMMRLAVYRGQAMRFILHGAGRATHGRNDRATR